MCGASILPQNRRFALGQVDQMKCSTDRVAAAARARFMPCRSSISPHSCWFWPRKSASHQFVTAKTAFAPSKAARNDASSSKSAFTTSIPSAASFFAASLFGFRVIALTDQPGVFSMMLTTPPPWLPVAPVTAMILLPRFGQSWIVPGNPLFSPCTIANHGSKTASLRFEKAPFL